MIKNLKIAGRGALESIVGPLSIDYQSRSISVHKFALDYALSFAPDKEKITAFIHSGDISAALDELGKVKNPNRPLGAGHFCL
jgi:hypothetical protein